MDATPGHGSSVVIFKLFREVNKNFLATVSCTVLARRFRTHQIASLERLGHRWRYAWVEAHLPQAGSWGT